MYDSLGSHMNDTLDTRETSIEGTKLHSHMQSQHISPKFAKRDKQASKIFDFDKLRIDPENMSAVYEAATYFDENKI
jgi:hypothetical protein